MINLRERFPKYKIEYDESYYAQHGRRSTIEDPDYMTIPCRYGHIFPWGRGTLAISLDHGRLASKLVRVGCQLWQDGSDGATLLFPVGLFDQVARIVKPRRRRQLSREEKIRRAQRMVEVRKGRVDPCQKRTSGAINGAAVAG